MEADLGLARLSPYGDGELVPIGREVADAVDGRCRAMRNDTLLDRALPTLHLRSQAQPRGPEPHMVRHGSAGEPVDPGVDAVKRWPGDKPFQRRPSNSGRLGLLTRNQPPLVLCDIGQASNGGDTSHGAAFYIRNE
jgi:hypothetical protein